MSFRLILFIIIQLSALFFFIEMLRRLAKRVNEYNLQDNRNTIPFGFVRLRHLVVLYVACYLVWVVFAIIFYLTFVDLSSSYYMGAGSAAGIELNL